MSRRIWLSSPHMGGNEKKFVNEAFESNWIAPLGPNVDNFEKELVEYTKACHCAALSSGTSAIHLALIILGVKKDDEVICQSFTFSASANPIIYQGAIPIFIDSEKTTWNIEPNLLEKAIKERIHKTGKKPAAVIIVHLYGMPARMDEITEICLRYEIPLIEDAAEALGSRYKDQVLGSFGVFGILSFNGNKIITTSGGGALLSFNEEYIKKARFLSTQARDQAPHYEHSQIGYNYRMSNICAGIGRGQLLVIEERVKQRRNNFEYYFNALKDIDCINFLKEPKCFTSNRWLTTITIESVKKSSVDTEAIRIALQNENIESRPLWKPMHLQPIFRNYPSYTSGVSESLFNKGLCLPSGSNLSENDLDRVIEVIRKLFRK